jgi:glycosyltransferase involved in cell wall biosynthesis
LILQVHGIEIWQPTRSWLGNRLVSRCDAVVSVSEVTLRRLAKWADLRKVRAEILPNTVHPPKAKTGAPRVTRASLGLEGRKILMTLGRMVGEERAKGFDEVLEALPRLARTIPEICYIAAGGGPDLERLQAKAQSLGVGDRVLFPGRISDDEKADYYRLADAFVMPSRGEGFGIVLLEAMAHGTPVLASRIDGGFEAVRGGELGVLADPRDREDLIAAIVEVLGRPRGVPAGLSHFGFEKFCERVAAILARSGIPVVPEPGE